MAVVDLVRLEDGGLGSGRARGATADAATATLSLLFHQMVPRVVRAVRLVMNRARVTAGQPPQPAELLLRELVIVVLDLLPQQSATLVFPLPVFVAVDLPVLAERRREGLRKQEELDVVASRREILLVAPALFVVVGQDEGWVVVTGDLQLLFDFAEEGGVNMAVG